MTEKTVQYDQLFERGTAGFVGKAVDLEEHTIYYETNANSDTPKRTFILGHGACGSAKFMNPVAQELINTVPNIKVINLDLPFHGHSISSESNENFDVHDYTKVVNELLVKLKEEGEIIGIAHWIGWSMGGSIGLLSNLSGNGVEELTLLNSSPVWDTVEGMLGAMPAMRDSETIVEVFKSICESQVVVNTDEDFTEEFMKNYYDMVPTGKVMVQDFTGITPGYYNIVDELQNITAKTLIISGTNDTVAEVKHQELMNEAISDSALILLEDDHCLLIKPYAVKIIVKAIVDRFTK